MKHNVDKPDLTAIFMSKSIEDRKEEVWLAFEAEYDQVRPFTINWSDDISHFEFEGMIYFYKPQYPNINSSNINELSEFVDGELVLSSESPHFYEFELG